MEDKPKSNILSTYFSDVCTSESGGIIPVMDDKPVNQNMELLVIEKMKGIKNSRKLTKPQDCTKFIRGCAMRQLRVYLSH